MRLVSTWLCRLGRGAEIGVIVWILAGLTVHLGWLLGSLTVSWSLHAVVVALGFGAWNARKRRWGRLSLLVACAVAGGLPWAKTLADDRAPVLAASTPHLRVLVANPYYAPPRLEALTEQIEATGAGLVALLEPPASLGPHLEGTGRWKVLAEHLPGDKFNIALVARRDLIGPDGPLRVLDAEPMPFEFTDSVAVQAHLLWLGRPLRVVVAHPPAPTHPVQQHQRWLLIPELGALAVADGEPGLLLADLNATMVSPLWRDLMQAGLRRPPGGTPATWPSVLGPFGVAIDHVLMTEHFAAREAAPVWLSWSDHRGVVTDIGWADPPKPR